MKTIYSEKLIVHGGKVHDLTGFVLMAYIYAIDQQGTDDIAVWQNVAKDTSWVRVRVKAFALKCASSR